MWLVQIVMGEAGTRQLPDGELRVSKGLAE